MADSWNKAGWRIDPNQPLDKLTQAVDNARKAVVNAATAADLAVAWCRFKDATKALEQLAPVPQNTISDFFVSVGRGVIEAQQALDRESIDYIQSKTKPPMPALFRVPKASAEISFAISSTEEKSFNVIVYGTTKQSEERNEQKVSFEVVAVPPPPDFLASTGVFLTGEGIRTTLKQRLEKYINTLGSGNDKDRLQLLFDNFSSTLIFAGKDPGNKTKAWLPADVWVLVYPHTNEETPEPDDYMVEVVSMSVVIPPLHQKDDLRLADRGWDRVQYLALLLHGLADEQRLLLNQPPVGK